VASAKPQEFAADIAGSPKDSGPNHDCAPIHMFAYLCNMLHEYCWR
jgi:hypothetical protein